VPARRFQCDCGHSFDQTPARAATNGPPRAAASQQRVR
jgi:hypothetical protein